MGRAKYHEYLASRTWAKKRNAVMIRANNRCERCRKMDADQVHHLSYEHVFHEPLTDLQAVCAPCHEFLSAKSDYDPAAPIVQKSVAPKPDKRMIQFYENGTDNWLLCPLCGGHNLHTGLSEEIDEGMAIPFLCETCDTGGKWREIGYLHITHHEGITSIIWKVHGDGQHWPCEQCGSKCDEYPYPFDRTEKDEWLCRECTQKSEAHK